MLPCEDPDKLYEGSFVWKSPPSNSSAKNLVSSIAGIVMLLTSHWDTNAKWDRDFLVWKKPWENYFTLKETGNNTYRAIFLDFWYYEQTKTEILETFKMTFYQEYASYCTSSLDWVSEASNDESKQNQLFTWVQNTDHKEVVIKTWVNDDNLLDGDIKKPCKIEKDNEVEIELHRVMESVIDELYLLYLCSRYADFDYNLDRFSLYMRSVLWHIWIAYYSFMMSDFLEEDVDIYLRSIKLLEEYFPGATMKIQEIFFNSSEDIQPQ